MVSICSNIDKSTTANLTRAAVVISVVRSQGTLLVPVMFVLWQSIAGSHDTKSMHACLLPAKQLPKESLCVCCLVSCKNQWRTSRIIS